MASTAQQAEEDQECPICYEALTGCLFQQPVCGHCYHEKCWNKLILTCHGDPMRCQRCLQPVDQKALSWMLQELSSFSHALPTDEDRPKVEELLTQLVALAESGLLEDEGLTRDSLTQEGTVRRTAHAVLFAYYMLALLEEADKCHTFDRKKHAEQLEQLRSPDLIVQLAALLWEREPAVVSRFPCMAQLLRLESSTGEAHFILGGLHSWTGAFQNSERAGQHLRKAWQEHHPRAGMALAELLSKLGKYEELTQVCEQLLSEDQNHAETNHHVGRLYLKCADLEKAELHLRRAFGSGNTTALYDLGKAFLNEGKLNKAKHCFWAVHNTAFSGDDKDEHKQAKHDARCELSKLLFHEGAREDALRVALILQAGACLPHWWRSNIEKASRLRDSVYWEPTMAVLTELGRGAILLSEIEHYFRRGCDDLTEKMLIRVSQRGPASLLIDLRWEFYVVLGWGYEEQGQWGKAARCYKRARFCTPQLLGVEHQPLSVAEMSMLHLRRTLRDPLVLQEIPGAKARITEGLKEALDKLQALSSRKIVRKSIRALFFEDATPEKTMGLKWPNPFFFRKVTFKRISELFMEGVQPLKHPTEGQEPIPLPDAQRAPPCGSSLGASCRRRVQQLLWWFWAFLTAWALAKPRQPPARAAPPAIDPSATARLKEDTEGEIGQRLVQRQPQQAESGQLVPMPMPVAQDTMDSMDDQDLDLQTALILSCTEQQDLLLAVRTNPVLMRAQHHVQPVPESQTGEKLFLMHFQRNSEEFKVRLHCGPLLAPCRAALEAAGHPWLLEDETGHTGKFLGRFGVKVFVHPNQYQAATDLLSQAADQMLQQQPPRRLYPNHVVVVESLLPLLLESLMNCSGTTLKRNGQVELGEVPLPLSPAESFDPNDSQSASTSDPLLTCLRVADMTVRKTFLNTPAVMRGSMVAQSEGPPAANPRRRKARSSLSSQSEVALREPAAGPPTALSTWEARFVAMPPAEPVHQPRGTKLAASSLRREPGSDGDKGISSIPEALPRFPAPAARIGSSPPAPPGTVPAPRAQAVERSSSPPAPTEFGSSPPVPLGSGSSSSAPPVTTEAGPRVLVQASFGSALD